MIGENFKEIKTFKKDVLYFIPLGGVEEIGMNINLYGYNGSWVVLDVGMTFSDTPGVDVIVPDIDFLKKIKVDAIIFTHAHEDHIGAVPYLWSKLNAPLYGTQFTMEMIRMKMQNIGLANELTLNTVKLESKFAIGPFEFEFINITHSIPEANMIFIRTPKGGILHTGDWKLDPDPVIGHKSSINKIKAIGKEGVTAMVCDSTNTFEEGRSGSEGKVRDSLTDFICKAKGKRIVVTCFASNVARLKACMEAAKESGRKVAVSGRSLKNMERISRMFGYLDKDMEILDDMKASSIEPGKVLYVCTGSQGEVRAALSRIASGEHYAINLKMGDVVLFSSKAIPGNERSIGDLKNKLAMKGIQIFQAEKFHTSGHPCKGELKEMYDMAKPKGLIPVHGEQRHLLEHARFGQSCGIKNTVVPFNGCVITIENDGSFQLIGRVHVDRLCVDGNHLVSVDDQTLRDRANMAENGVAMFSIHMQNDGKYQIRTMICGLNPQDAKGLSPQTNKSIHSFLKKAINEHPDDQKNIRDDFRKAMLSYFRSTSKKNPKVVVHII